MRETYSAGLADGLGLGIGGTLVFIFLLAWFFHAKDERKRNRDLKMSHYHRVRRVETSLDKLTADVAALRNRLGEHEDA